MMVNYRSRYIVPTVLLLLLSACGGAGGNDISGNGNNVNTTDSTPNSFKFHAINDSEPSVIIESNEIEISGINTSVSIEIANGEYAIDGGDYSSDARTITNGQKVTVRLTSSEQYNETVSASLTVSNVTADFSVTTKQAPIPEVSVADATITEGDSGTSTLLFHVTLSEPAPIELSAPYWTLPQTATQGRDYQQAKGTVNFMVGESTAAIEVTVYADTAYEHNETFEVVLGNGEGYTLAKRMGLGTISDDDESNKAAYVNLLTTFLPLKDELHTADYEKHNLFSAWVYDQPIDLDDDGDEDLLLFSNRGEEPNTIQNNIRIFRNDGAGNWVVEETDIATYARFAPVGDINNDGMEDVYVVQHGDHQGTSLLGAQDSMLIQGAAGGLIDITATALPQVNGKTHSGCLGDFNNDGWLDAYSGDFDDYQILINTGGVAFDKATDNPFIPYTQYPADGFTYCLVSDFTGDGIDDLILGTGGSPNSVDHLGNTIGEAHALYRSGADNHSGLSFNYPDDFIPVPFKRSLEGEELPEQQATLEMIAFDLNADGCQDFASHKTDYNTEANVNIFVNDCSGNFTLVQTITGLKPYTEAMSLVDIDDDGDNDLVISIGDSNTEPYEGWRASARTVLVNNGEGRFDARAGVIDDLPNVPLIHGVLWQE